MAVKLNTRFVKNSML